MKYLKFVLLAAGLWIFFAVCKSVGIDQARGAVRDLGWSLLPLFSIYLAVYASNAWGWILSFPKLLPAHVPFRDLFLIRLVGETLNSLIPWAPSLGGEPVKAQMLKDRHGIPVADGLASLLIVHTTLYVSLNAFVLGAVTFSWRNHPLTPALRTGVIGFLAVLGIGAAALAAGIYFGVFAKAHLVGKKFGWWKRHHGDELAERFVRLDHDVRAFFATDRRRFWLSSAWNLAALMAGVLETWWLGRLLGLDIGFRDAWLLEALIQALRIITFFIPGSVGAQEGGIVYIFTQLGFAGPAGLAFALIRRLREICWMGVGLSIWPFVYGIPKKR